MPTYTFTGTATADTAEQAEALAKQQAEDEALLSQGAFVSQTSYNEVYVKLNNDDTYTVTFILKVTDESPTDSTGGIVTQSDPGAAQTSPAPVPTNAATTQTPVPTTNQAPPKIQTTGSNPTVNTSSIPGAVAQAPNALDPGNQNEPDTSYIYRAIEVLSIFSRGQFIQEIQGAQIFFDVPETPKKSDTTRQESTPTASQADVRRVDNRIAADAANAPPPPVEERRTPQPGEGNQDPSGATDAAAILTAAAATPPTSGGQPVGTTPTNTTGGVSQQTTPVPITLLNGTTATVTTVDQVNNLLSTGQIDFRTASGATVALNSRASAQTPRFNLDSTHVMSLER